MQGRLFPLKIVDVRPPLQATADCRMIGIGKNGIAYAIKQPSDGRLIPLSEWFCSHLAHDVDIPTPPYEIVELPGGTLAFGSRWEGGTKEAQTSESDMLITGKINPAILSAIYAFDLFTGNMDRRLGNYLLRYDNISAPIPTLIASQRPSGATNTSRPPSAPSPLSAPPNACRTARQSSSMPPMKWRWSWQTIT